MHQRKFHHPPSSVGGPNHTGEGCRDRLPVSNSCVWECAVLGRLGTDAQQNARNPPNTFISIQQIEWNRRQRRGGCDTLLTHLCCYSILYGQGKCRGSLSFQRTTSIKITPLIGCCRCCMASFLLTSWLTKGGSSSWAIPIQMARLGAENSPFYPVFRILADHCPCVSSVFVAASFQSLLLSDLPNVIVGHLGNLVFMSEGPVAGKAQIMQIDCMKSNPLRTISIHWTFLSFLPFICIT